MVYVTCRGAGATLGPSLENVTWLLAHLLGATGWEPPGNEHVQNNVGVFISVGPTELSEGKHPECRYFKNTALEDRGLGPLNLHNDQFL